LCRKREGKGGKGGRFAPMRRDHLSKQKNREKTYGAPKFCAGGGRKHLSLLEPLKRTSISIGMRRWRAYRYVTCDASGSKKSLGGTCTISERGELREGRWLENGKKEIARHNTKKIILDAILQKAKKRPVPKEEKKSPYPLS